LIDEFGDIGPNKLILMDCELAAQNAIEVVFPGSKVRSCNFHFTKNVLDYIKNNGLKDLLADKLFYKWLNGVLGRF
jgi:transposase-like protein